MVEHRPRATCLKCGRDVAVTEVAGLVAHHHDRRTGKRCEGSGKVPAAGWQLVRFEDLVDLIENLDTYIERRAQQIADDRLKERRNG
jgi:hypothetical protein